MTYLFRTRLAPLLVLVCGAAPVAALDLAPPVNLCAIAAELAPEVTRLTGYATGPTCPEIAFTLPARAASATGKDRAGEYNFDTRAIGLAADLDMSGAYGRSILLHEMVHAAQHRAGKDPECRAELEYEAYMAQATYLRAHGEAREATLAMVLAGLVSSCGPRYH